MTSRNCRSRISIAPLITFLGALLLVASASLLQAGPGYLPLLGPKPLRFRKPPPTLGPVQPLPPLEMAASTFEELPEPPAPNSTNEAPAVTLSAPAPPPFDLGPSSTNLSATPAAGTSEPAPEPPAATLTPQMLMQFFQNNSVKSTNQTTTAILAPISFAPPRPAAPASSTATYQKR